MERFLKKTTKAVWGFSDNVVELNVTLIVRDPNNFLEKFLENSHNLCTWSKHPQLIQMTAESELTFEIFDRTPSEWKLIKELTSPFPKQKVNMDNIDIALVWFGRFVSVSGLEECDNFLLQSLEDIQAPTTLVCDPTQLESEELKTIEDNFEKVLKIWAKCYSSNLPNTYDACNSKFQQFIKVAPFLLKTEIIQRVISNFNMDDDDAQREGVWGLFSPFLPPSVSDMTPEQLIDNPPLPALILSQLQLHHGHFSDTQTMFANTPREGDDEGDY